MGWSYAPLSMDEVLTNLGLDPHAAQLVVSDITQSAQAAPFYRTPLAEGVGAETATLDLQQGFYGRQWSWRCMFTRHLPKLNLFAPEWVVLIGVMLSILKGVLIWTLTQSRQRKSLLRSEQARRAAIVESSIDAIIGKALDGTVTSWNQGPNACLATTPAKPSGVICLSAWPSKKSKKS